MTFQTGDADLDTLANDLLRRLVEVQRQDAAVHRTPIRETSFHDFASNRLLLTPQLVAFTESDPGLAAAPVNMDGWSDFEWFIGFFRDVIRVQLLHVFAIGVVVLDEETSNDYALAYNIENEELTRREFLTLRIRDVFAATMGLALFDLYLTAADRADFLINATEVVESWLYNELRHRYGGTNELTAADVDDIISPEFWAEGTPGVIKLIGAFERIPPSADEEPPFGERLPPRYTFTPFEPDTVNFGFRLVHRQTWTPLGTQPGEVVRTLPLGPRQAEKIGVKVVVTSKSSRQSESIRSLETSTETSATSKDSSEIVEEASSKFNWDVKGNAGGTIDGVTLGVNAGAGGEFAASSRATKTMLNEAIRKTASKFRSDNKIVVTTERERLDERSQYSEIVNPNDDIAVTYIYSRLQRQYEIQTTLAEVVAVAYVSERVPAPKDLTPAWIRRHDWIISGALLDESFREDLELLRSNERSTTDDQKLDGNIEKLMVLLTINGIPDYSAVSGTIPNLFETQQQAYERELERLRARQAADEQYRRAARRLRAHIYDNILYYCRAIWGSEDPNSRYLRFRAIRVPVRWEFLATGAPGNFTVEGLFAPAVEDIESDTRMLADLVDLSGPLGYCGNYSVYALRASDEWPSLTNMIDLARVPYLRISVGAVHEDPRRSHLFRCFGAAAASRQESRRYRLAFRTLPQPVFQVHEEQAANVFALVEELPFVSGNPVQFRGIRVWITPLATEGAAAPPAAEGTAVPATAQLTESDSFLVSVVQLPLLEDPERRVIKWSLGPLRESEKAEFFVSDVLNTFVEYFSDCADAVGRDARSQLTWAALDQETRKVFVGRYFDYILRLRYTQRFFVNSNDVVLTREIDSSSSLEPFKSVHRYIDALSAYEELVSKRLENQRREARIAANLLGDPDIDKVTVVTAPGDARSMAALDGLVPDAIGVPSGGQP